MDLSVKIVTFLGLIGHLSVVNSVTMLPSSSSSNDSKTTYYTGLLSDVLFTNRENDLEITPLCNQELSAIQNGLDMRDIWAIKCKYSIFCVFEENICNYLPLWNQIEEEEEEAAEKEKRLTLKVCNLFWVQLFD